MCINQDIFGEYWFWQITWEKIEIIALHLSKYVTSKVTGLQTAFAVNKELVGCVAFVDIDLKCVRYHIHVQSHELGVNEEPVISRCIDPLVKTLSYLPTYP